MMLSIGSLGFGCGAAQIIAAPLPDPAAVASANGDTLIQWLEAGQGKESVASGGNPVINTLAAMDANNYGYLSSGSSRPLLQGNHFGGAPCWLFDGNDYLINADTGTGAAAVATVSGNDKAFTRFVVYQILDASVLGYIWSCGNTGLGTNYIGFYSDNTGLHATKRDASLTKTVDALGSQSTARTIAMVQSDGTRCRIKKDNVEIAPYASANFDVGAIVCNTDALGVRITNTTTGFAKVRVAASVTVAGVASAATEDGIYAYLKAKFIDVDSKSLVVCGNNSMTQISSGIASWVPYINLPNTIFADSAVTGEQFGPVGGSTNTLAKMFNYYTSVLNANRGINAIVLMNPFTNDLAVGARTASACLADAATFGSSIKAAFPTVKLIGSTCFKRVNISGGQETERLALNSGWLSSHANYDAIVDLATIIPEAPSDTSVFNADQVHLAEAAAQNRVAPAFRTVLQGFGCS